MADIKSIKGEDILTLAVNTQELTNILIKSVLGGTGVDRLSRYVVDKKALAMYKSSLNRLTMLKWQGLVDFDYMDSEDSYVLHVVNVRFPERDDGIIELEAKTKNIIASMFSQFDNVIVDTENPYEWQFSVAIYKPL